MSEAAPSPTPPADPAESRSGAGGARRQVARATGIMMAAILASRLLGLVRDMVIANRFGQNIETDIYKAAFIVPDLMFFLIAGGALSSAFIPVFTEYLKTGREKEAWHIFSSVACVMTIVVGLFVVVATIFAPQFVSVVVPGFTWAQTLDTARLTRIVLPAQLCFFLGGLMMGTLYSRQHFLVPALGPVVYNLGIIFGGVALAGWLGIDGLAWGALAGAVVGNFGLQLFQVRRMGWQFRPTIDLRHPGVRRVGALMLPVILGLSLPQVDIQINKFFASFLEQGKLSGLDNANRLMQMPLGVFAQAAAVAIFPTLSAQAAERDLPALRATVNYGLRWILFLTVPASILMIALAAPIVRFLFEHGQFTADDTAIAASALVFYSAGIFAWSGQAIIARGFYALQDTRTPVISGTIVTLLFIPLNWLLMGPVRFGRVEFPAVITLGHNGLALATTIAATVHMLALLAILGRRFCGIDGARLTASVGRIVAASALCGLVAWGVRLGIEPTLTERFPPTISAGLTLAVAGAAGALVYAGLAVALRMDEASGAWALVRRKLRR